MKKGQLLVIEGIDGSGKTTQINLLSKYLKEKDIDFEVISFPQYGKNEYAKNIFDYLCGEFGQLKDIDPYELAEVYANDRKSARELIKSWLYDGKLVIANRYISSSKAHLGANLDETKRENFIRWIDELEYKTNDMPKEDLTILLDVDPSIGQKNSKIKNHPDLHEDSLKHLENANQIFLELSKKENNWVVINCMNDGGMRRAEDINKEINLLLEKKLVNIYYFHDAKKIYFKTS